MTPARRRPSRRGLTPERALAWFPVVVRYGGFLLAAHQILVEDGKHPVALAFIGTMMGLNEVVAAIAKAAAGKERK